MNKIPLILAIFWPTLASAAIFHGGDITATGTTPILDTVGCASSTDAAYGTVKLRSSYSGYAIQMRVKQSGVYVYQNIGFTSNVMDSASADAFAATADAGTPAELRFYDQCGNGNDTAFSATSTIKGATWSSMQFANTPYRFASFDLLYDNPASYSSTQQLVLPSTITLNMDAFSTVLVGRLLPYINKTETLWELTNTAPWASRLFSDDLDSGVNILEKSGATLNYAGLESLGVYQTIAGASTFNVLANEVSISRTKGTISATSNSGGYLGWNSGTNGILGGQDIIAQMFFNRTLNGAEQAAVANYGYALEGNPTTIPNCIVVVGDSLSQGTAAVSNQNYINQAIHGAGTTITKQTRLYNYATGGISAATITGNSSRYTAACGNASVTNKLAVIMAGTNDIIAGTAPATVATSVYSICTAMHNAGFKTVVATIPNNNSANHTNIATLNANIEANYAANNCNALADVWANANVGSGSNTANTTYFASDALHLTATGYGVIGGIIAAAVNTVF